MPPSKAYPDGLWLFFGGRTNGLHNFTASGVSNFPPDFQNEDIIVINPANWQTWSVPWSQTDVPVSTYNSLSSAAQDFYQKGNTLYTVGGYSVPDTINFTGNTTNGSTTVDVSSIAGLAIGQYVTGAAIPVINPTTQAAVDVTITAIGTNTITLSQPAIATATATALTASTNNFTTYDTLTSINIKGMIGAVMSGGDVAQGGGHSPDIGPPARRDGRRDECARRADVPGLWPGLPGRVRRRRTLRRSTATRSGAFVSSPVGKTLAIRGYQALRDPTDFRRRDGNIEVAITPSGQSRADLLRRRLHAGKQWRRLCLTHSDRLER